MRISLVITVLNEERTIKNLLFSLKKQTRKPEEIIFVDGGSQDKTIEILKDFCKNNPSLTIKIIKLKKATVAQGRNIGIKKAKNEIIVMTDAGCIPYKDWFEKITKPFENPNIDIAAGFYKMTGKTVFQKCLACYLGVLPQKLNPLKFLPSARSIAFKKEIWQKIGGFSEKLTKAGEDTLFNYQAKKLGAKFFTVVDALVDWEMPKTFIEAFEKFLTYAQGDFETHYWPHMLKIIFVFFRYFLILFLIFLAFLYKISIVKILIVILFFSYFFWVILKNYRYVNHPLAFFYLFLIQIIADLAVMFGFLKGALNGIRR